MICFQTTLSFFFQAVLQNLLHLKQYPSNTTYADSLTKNGCYKLCCLWPKHRHEYRASLCFCFRVLFLAMECKSWLEKSTSLKSTCPKNVTSTERYSKAPLFHGQAIHLKASSLNRTIYNKTGRLLGKKFLHLQRRFYVQSQHSLGQMWIAHRLSLLQPI